MADPTPLIPGYNVVSDVVAADLRVVTYRKVPAPPPAAPVLRVRVANAADCSPVAELTDGGTLQPGQGLVVDTNPRFAALRFAVNNKDINRVN